MYNNNLQQNSKQKLKVAVLVSVGCHPVSGRARRAVNDAQALEMGLALAGQWQIDLSVLHAGQLQEAALRPYLGMGIDAIDVLALPPGTDVLISLIARLRTLQPQLILTGTRAESGWSSGCLPYFLAQQLGFPIVSGVDDITLPDAAGTAAVRKVLPRGQRRALDVSLPAVITVDVAAPAPRQSAFARARRGQLKVEDRGIDAIPPVFFGDAQPARKRPKRLRMDTSASAAERLRAITKVAGGHGRVTEPGTPTEAAEIIYQHLAESGLLKSRYRGANKPLVNE